MLPHYQIAILSFCYCCQDVTLVDIIAFLCPVAVFLCYPLSVAMLPYCRVAKLLMLLPGCDPHLDHCKMSTFILPSVAMLPAARFCHIVNSLQKDPALLPHYSPWELFFKMFGSHLNHIFLQFSIMKSWRIFSFDSKRFLWQQRQQIKSVHLSQNEDSLLLPILPFTHQSSCQALFLRTYLRHENIFHIEEQPTFVANCICNLCMRLGMRIHSFCQFCLSPHSALHCSNIKLSVHSVHTVHIVQCTALIYSCQSLTVSGSFFSYLLARIASQNKTFLTCQFYLFPLPWKLLTFHIYLRQFSFFTALQNVDQAFMFSFLNMIFHIS